MAMKNRDLTFVIKVQNAAKSALQALRGDLSNAGKGGQDAAKGISAASTAWDDLGKRAKMGADAVKAATASNVSSANQEAAAQQRVAAAYDKATAAKQRNRNSRGQFVSAGAFTVGGTTGSRAANAAIVSDMNSMEFNEGALVSAAGLKAMKAEADKLKAALYPATTQYETLMAKQKLYDDMLKAGVIDQRMHAGATQLVKNELQKLEEETVKHTNVMKGNAYTIREVTASMRELARGDYSRLASTGSILAQQFGILDAVLTALTGPLGVVLTLLGVFGAAVGVVTTLIASADEENTHLTNTLKLQAATSGLTVDGFKQLAKSVADYSNVSVSSAQKVAQTLATSGAFTADQIRTLSDDAEMLGRATGESADKIAQSFAKMSEGAGKYAESFAQDYNGILSPAQARIIKDMDDRGQKEQALELLIKDVNKGVVDNTQQSTNKIVNFWHDALTAISDYWHTFMEHFSDDPADKLDILKKQIAVLGGDQALADGRWYGQWGKDLLAQEQGLEKIVAAKKADTQATADQQRQSNQFFSDMDRWQSKLKDNPLKFTGDQADLSNWVAQAQQALKEFDTTGKLPKLFANAFQNMTKTQINQEIEMIRFLVKQRTEVLKELQKSDLPGETKLDTANAKKISAQEAIYRYGLELQGQGFKISENPHFGGVTPGVHHGLGHAQDRAIDVNSVAGDDAAVAWARAKDTALAMEAASKGFVALFNHTRYAPSANGGFTTSQIAAGQDQHTSHVHVEAQGLMSANGLKSMGQAQMELANKAREVALYQQQVQDSLQAQVDEAGKLPSEAKAYAEVQKVVENSARAGIDIDQTHQNLLYQQYKTMIDQASAAQAVNQLRENNISLEKQNYVSARARVGLSAEDQAVEDAKNAATLQYMQKFGTLQDALNHLGDAKFQNELRVLETYTRQNIELDRQHAYTEELVKLQNEQVKNSYTRATMGLIGYDQTRAQAVNDRRWQIAEGKYHLDPSSVSDPKYAPQWKEINSLAEQYGKELDLNHQKQLQLAGDLGYGLRDGLAQWAEQARNVAGEISNLVQNTLNNLVDMLTTFVTTGKMGFKSFVTSAIQDIEKLIIKMLVLKAIEAGLNMIVPGLGTAVATGAGFATHHTGGMAGVGGGVRYANPMAFLGAPRLHDGGMAGDAWKRMMGLKSNEVPAILRDDERVLNPQQTKAYNAGLAGRMSQSTMNQTVLHFAPNIVLGGGGDQGAGGGLSAAQGQRAGKELEDQLNIFMTRWVATQARPGGVLYQGQR